MRKAIFFLLMILAVFVGLASFFGFQEIKFFKTKADVTQASFSIDNSYLFVTPLRALANGSEKIRVTVFILNDQGLGVLGKPVVLGTDPNLKIETIQAVSDQYGKAVFDVSSSRAGEYYLEVKIDNKPLTQQAHLSFY